MDDDGDERSRRRAPFPELQDLTPLGPRMRTRIVHIRTDRVGRQPDYRKYIGAPK